MGKENNNVARKVVATLTEKVAGYLKDRRNFGGSGNGARLGTIYEIISPELAFVPAEGGINEYIGWECASDRPDRKVYLTPRRLEEFTGNMQNSAFVASIKWLDGKSAKDAFVLSDAAYNDASTQKELDEMAEWLSEHDGKCMVIGKAEHPRFKGTFINVYGSAE